MVKPQAPRVIIFAGPNGAGKSTHADAIVTALGINTFVNADYIARGLSGRNADAVAMQAGRIMLTRLKELAAAQQDFAFEIDAPQPQLRALSAPAQDAGVSGGDLLFLADKCLAGGAARQAACGDGWA